MLALFLNHPPLFVAGEIALGLSLALFAGALIAAVIRGARISQLRETGHPSATSVRRSLGEAVYPRTNVPGLRRFDPVNGTWIFLRTGAGKFPSLAGWRSAVRWISASVLWGSSTTLEGRWNWCS